MFVLVLFTIVGLLCALANSQTSNRDISSAINRLAPSNRSDWKGKALKIRCITQNPLCPNLACQIKNSCLEGERIWFPLLRTHILACDPSADRFFATAVGK